MTMAKEMNNNKDLDLIEDTIGAVGRWQLIMVFLISLMRVHISWHQLGIVFLAPETEFHCSDENITDECSPDCPSYEYDRSMFTETIISEWDLVCDNKFYINNVLQPMIMAGILIGSLIFGYISDRFGRKYPLLIAAILEAATGVAAAYVPWLEAFIALKFLSAIFIGAILLISFILAVELIGKSHRTFIGTLVLCPYYLGYAFMAVIGYLIRDWRNFQLAISVTNFIFIIYIWIIPESPRWLLLVGRTDESVAILQKAAKHNKLTTYNIREKVLVHEKQAIACNSKAGNYLDLFRTKEMTVRTIYISIATFGVFVTYFGTSQYLGQIGKNKFVTVGFSGMLQTPACLLSIFIMDKLGRRYSLIMSNVLSGICCLLIIAVPEDVNWGVSICGAVGIMFGAMSVVNSFIYTGELFPTVIRSSGMGFAAVFGKLGSTIAPFFLDLKDDYPWLPPTIFGTVSIVAALFCIGLPETLNMKLPETIEEAEELSKYGKKPMITVMT